MRSPKCPSARPLACAVLAACAIGGTWPAAHAEQRVETRQAAAPGQYIAVWDPPPFSIRAEYAHAGQATLGEAECPSFVFRNSFELGRLDGALPPDNAGAPIRYTTAAGFTVQIDKHRIWIQDPWGMNKVEHWGDLHENLNGKHIKDWGGMAGWDGSRRTILIDGGAKVTMEATGPQGVVLHTSIYDGQQNVQIENSTNTDNVSNEDSGFNVVPFDVPLGETGGCANPNQVKDFFDDPRMPHT